MLFNVDSLLIKVKEWLFWQPLGIIWEDEVQAYLHNCKCTISGCGLVTPAPVSSSELAQRFQILQMFYGHRQMSIRVQTEFSTCDLITVQIYCVSCELPLEVICTAWWVITLPVGRTGERWGCYDDSAPVKYKKASVKLQIHQSQMESEALERVHECTSDSVV